MGRYGSVRVRESEEWMNLEAGEAKLESNRKVETRKEFEREWRIARAMRRV